MINEQHQNDGKDGTVAQPSSQTGPRSATSPSHHAGTSSIMLDSVNGN
jgi:hypothetical protein